MFITISAPLPELDILVNILNLHSNLETNWLCGSFIVGFPYSYFFALWVPILSKCNICGQTSTCFEKKLWTECLCPALATSIQKLMHLLSWSQAQINRRGCVRKNIMCKNHDKLYMQIGRVECKANLFCTVLVWFWHGGIFLQPFREKGFGIWYRDLEWLFTIAVNCADNL